MQASGTAQRVLVTAGGSGIGRAIAERFLAAGALVHICDVAPAALETTLAANPGLRGSLADVGVPAEVEALVAAAAGWMGGIDVLVNNAGITRDNLAMRMKDEEWSQVMQINLESAFRLMRAAARPMMKARFGRIVNITSVVGATGNPGQMNYAAAKAGLVGASKSLAQELATRGITVNCIAPGFIRTAMTDQLPDAQKDLLNARIPMGRMGESEDIGAAAAYLASKEAAYVTGQTLHVNGGMAMMS